MQTLRDYHLHPMATVGSYRETQLASVIGDLEFTDGHKWGGALLDTLGEQACGAATSAKIYYYYEHCAALVTKRLKYNSAPLGKYQGLMARASKAREQEVLRGLYYLLQRG